MLNDAVVSSYPGLLGPSELIREMRYMLPGLAGFDWERLESSMSVVPLARLQAFQVDAALRGRRLEVQGPEWASQLQRASLLASFGRQRATGDSKRGLAPC